MRRVQVREAKATFSSLIEAAERGEPTTITRHGKPAAVVVPVEDAERLYAAPKKTFVELLFEYPGGIDLERDQTPLKAADL